MALAVNRTGVIFKKCDLSNHKPDINKNCAAGTCQHTCDKPDRCAHAWTLRYWGNGAQREQERQQNFGAAVEAYISRMAVVLMCIRCCLVPCGTGSGNAR